MVSEPYYYNHIINHFQVTCSRIIFQGPALRSCWTRCRSRPVDIPEAAARWHCGGSMKHLALRREIVGNWLGNLMWSQLMWRFDHQLMWLGIWLGRTKYQMGLEFKEIFGFSRLITNGDAKGDISGYTWRIWRFTQWKRRVHNQVNVNHYIYIYIYWIWIHHWDLLPWICNLTTSTTIWRNMNGSRGLSISKTLWHLQSILLLSIHTPICSCLKSILNLQSNINLYGFWLAIWNQRS